MTVRRLAAFSRVLALCAGAASCRTLGPAGALARPHAHPSALTANDARIDAIVARMTLAEKIGQMTQADQQFLKDSADVERYFLGSILSGGDSDPKEGNSPEAWRNLYLRLQRHAMSTRLGIPLLYGVDAVHGHSNVLGAVIFPHDIGMGATHDPALVRRAARVTAEEMRATGVHWTFAPCVCVPRDERWGRTYEGFSEDPKLVSVLGAAAVEGFQGRSLDDPASVLATAKHFLGDGGTLPGTAANHVGLDQGDMRGSEEMVREIHLRPYRAAVAAGVDAIMPSYSSWNGVKMSGSRYLLTDVLKGELGFQGFLISDYDALNQLDRDYRKAIEKSINAGMDMVMVPQNYREFIRDLTELVNEGRVPMSRIDDAVRRILRVKFAMGLMDDPARAMAVPAALRATFGSPEHRAVARQAVRESMVLLKNRRHLLPLSPRAARIAVAGKNADDLGNQTGGWTITWQGRSGAVTPGGTTILAAIRRAVSPATQVTYTRDGTGAAGADIGIVVIGETPYAEGQGDRTDLSLDDEDRMAVRNLKAAGIPVVVVLVSGRPMILDEVIDEADAFVAAWLPGTEGDGVADVLFGTYRPTGRLPVTWPRAMQQLPLNGRHAGRYALFPLGYGLRY